MGRLAFTPDGTLYATLSDVSPAPAKLYALGTSAGAATFVGNLGFNSASGTTFLTPVPEPESWMLLPYGVVIVSVWGQRRIRQVWPSACMESLTLPL